jgi:hypothetical protein
MGAPQDYDRKEILYRIGTFFLLIGVGLLIFFLMSEAEQNPIFSYFCWSMVLLIAGFLFRAQYKKALPPSGRFSILKKLKPKPKKEEAKK